MIEDVEHAHRAAGDGTTSLTGRQPGAGKPAARRPGSFVLIDLFTLALTHGLMALALWRLLFRADLDDDTAGQESRPRPWRKRPSGEWPGDA
jgi:hypothetical protein